MCVPQDAHRTTAGPPGSPASPRPRTVAPPHLMAGATTEPRLREAGFLGLFLLLGAIGAWRILAVLPERSNGLDFAHYYASSRLLLRGADPYTADLRAEVERLGLDLEGLVEGATNPPPLAALLVPVAALPTDAAYAVWTAIQALCLAAFLWLIVIVGGFSGRGAIYLGGAALFSYAVYAHFFYAQTQLLLGALLLFGLRLLSSGRPVPAALVVAATGLLKLFPFLLLPWFVWRSGSRRARWTAAAAAAVMIGGAVALQWSLWLSFLRHAPPTIGTAVQGLPFNFSVPSVLIRLGIPAGLAMLPGLVLLGVGYLVCVRRGNEELPGQLALLICLLVAATATGWGHYHVLLLFPFAFFARELTARPTPVRLAVVWAVYMLAIFLVHVPGVHGGPLVLLAALPLYGNIGLAGYWAWRLESRAVR